ncbi:integrase-like protein [Palleronia aestuarii]|uniref:Integrase-like protein n=1 Tax=Palleronia aestuarii TaxID=568105 RepID=A0A2W7MZR3_9RHOB|nr:integrase-like protein [Palleronia aestuarii]
MESFFRSLKTERIYHRSYATRDEARRNLFAWIKGWYDTHCLHSALGYRSPAAIERMVAQSSLPNRGKIKSNMALAKGPSIHGLSRRPNGLRAYRTATSMAADNGGLVA